MSRKAVHRAAFLGVDLRAPVHQPAFLGVDLRAPVHRAAFLGIRSRALASKRNSRATRSSYRVFRLHLSARMQP